MTVDRALMFSVLVAVIAAAGARKPAPAREPA